MFQRLLGVAVTPPPSAESRASPEGGQGGLRGIKPFVPVAAVLVALLALTIIGLALERQVSAVTREIIEMADPAEDRVRDIQMLLAREAAGVRGYLLTGETIFLARHHEARRARKAAVAQLGALVRSSSEDLRNLVALLALELRPADAMLDSLHGGQLSREQYVERLGTQQHRFEAVTETTRRLGETLSSGAARRVTDIQTAQRRALFAGIPLIALAVLAVILVSDLAIAYRSLASSERLARAESEAASAEAERRRAELERITESRARLVRGFTHDVKNPLNAAAGVLALVRDGLLDSGDGIRRAHRSVLSAIRLIDDILHIARDESGDILVIRGAMDLRDAARETADDWRALAESKGLALRVEEPESYPIIESDGEKVRQILGNLISNAVRYTTAGSVTVRVATRNAGTSPARARWATVEVRDTGPGLSAEQLRQLFQEYRRLETSAGTTGNGLGLAISKRLATALGGHISVESDVGAGSAFTLSLPCEKTALSMTNGLTSEIREMA